MEEVNYNFVLEVVQEELARVGIQNSCTDDKKTSFYQSGSKFLGLSTGSKSKCNDYCSDSPKRDKISSFDGNKTPKLKNASKSPFASKNKLERKSGRKKKRATAAYDENTSNCQVFGCELDSMEVCDSVLQDDLTVSIPKFVVDACNVIKENITIEGLFRKAGSAQRQQTLKGLLTSGYSLPTTIHPVDAACLLKQFLRQLSTPLLSSQVHYLMIKCLDLARDDQLDTLALCTLLLPKRNRDLLAYVLELLSFVTASSHVNLMDSHNLAIVLAPNLIPPSKSCVKNSTEDKLLSSTIDVIQLLIEGASAMCRISSKIILAAQHKEKCQSMENLCDLPPQNGTQKKKRRSASIQRVLIGLRRVCQGVNSVQTPIIPSSPLTTVTTPPISQERACDISMDPDIDMKPFEKAAKRKSEGCEALRISEEKVVSLPLLESSRPNKKAKIELKSARADSLPFLQSSYVEGDQHTYNTSSYKVERIFEEKKTPDNLKRRHSFKEKMDFVFSNDKVEGRRKYLKARGSDKQFQSCYSLNAEADSASPIKVTKRVKSFNFPKTNSRICRIPRSFLKSNDDENDLLILRSQRTPNSTSLRSGKSPNANSMRSIKSPSTVSSSIRPSRSPGTACLRPGWSPSAASTRSLRSPSRAASLRPSRSPGAASQRSMRSPGGFSLGNLGPRGIPDGAESVVEDVWTVTRIPSKVSHVSNTQLVCDKYDQVIYDTKNLITSTDETLSRRLDKELRIRKRRSEEHRVIRSPSERKIGSIRRRSKELELTLTKKQRSSTDLKNATPKLKDALLLSPQPSLRRGKPNSIKSGLPVVVKSLDSMNKITPPPKTVCIYKRKSCSPVFADQTTLSKENISENLNGTYVGPMTRRRSSIFSQEFNSSSNLHSMNNSFDLSFKSSSELSSNISNLENLSLMPNGSLVVGSGRDLEDGDVEWVAAPKFMKDMKLDSNSHMPAEMSGSRPSITALKEQKKVTANVQLFSQLQDQYGGATPSRRGSRFKNPYHPMPLRNTKSDGCTPKQQILNKSPLIRLDHQIPRSKLHGSHMVHGNQQVTSPLKERNISSEIVTPRIMGKERRASKVKRFESMNLPSGLSTPLPPRPFKPPHLVTPIIGQNLYETPPRIPPKASGMSSCKSRSSSMKSYR